MVGFQPRLETLEGRTLPSTISWLRPLSGDWDVPANWAGGRVPGSSDDAVIPFRGITVTHTTAAADAVNSLNSEAAIDLSAGSLAINPINGTTSSRIDDLFTMRGGTLRVIDSTLSGSGSLRNTGTVTVNSLRALLIEGGDFTNSGTVSLTGFGGVVVTGNYVQTAGSTQLKSGLLTAGLVDLEGGALSGTGVINAKVLNNAEVDVGQPGSPGTLTVVGDYTQTAGGDLVVEIGGLNPGTGFDQLNVTGRATLDSTLTANLINRFVPESGNSFTVVTFGSGSGAFATLNGDGPLFAPRFNPDDVILVAN